MSLVLDQSIQYFEFFETCNVPNNYNQIHVKIILNCHV